jgi:hypothetical protein
MPLVREDGTKTELTDLEAIRMFMRNMIQISSEDEITMTLLRESEGESKSGGGTHSNTPQEDHLAIHTPMDDIVNHWHHW